MDWKFDKDDKILTVTLLTIYTITFIMIGVEHALYQGY
jgi:hypothetical protein